MSRIVYLPDLTKILAPDNASDEEALSWARQNFPEAFVSSSPRTEKVKPEPGVMSDVGNILKSGTGQGIASLGKLGQYVGIGGKDLERYGTEVSESATKALSPGTQEALQRQFIEKAPEGEGFLGYKLGPGKLSDIPAQALQSVPVMGATMAAAAGATFAVPATATAGVGAGVLGFLTRVGLTKVAARITNAAAPTAGAAEALAGRLAIATLSGNAAEGLAAVGSSGIETENAVLAFAKQDPDTFFRSPIGQKALQDTDGDREKAIALGAFRSGRDVGALTGISTALLATPGSAFEALAVFGKGAKALRLRNAIIGGIAEGPAQELFQSAAEQYIQNLKRIDVGEKISPSEGVVEAGVQGALVGAPLGGALGALSGKGKQPDARPLDNQFQLLAAQYDAETAGANPTAAYHRAAVDMEKFVKQGDEITVFDANGKPFEVTVGGKNEAGRTVINGFFGTSVLGEDYTISSPTDPRYGVPVGPGQFVSPYKLTEEDLGKKVAEYVEIVAKHREEFKQTGVGNPAFQQDLRILTSLNAAENAAAEETKTPPVSAAPKAAPVKVAPVAAAPAAPAPPAQAPAGPAAGPTVVPTITPATAPIAAAPAAPAAAPAGIPAGPAPATGGVLPTEVVTEEVKAEVPPDLAAETPAPADPDPATVAAAGTPTEVVDTDKAAAKDSLDYDDAAIDAEAEAQAKEQDNADTTAVATGKTVEELQKSPKEIENAAAKTAKKAANAALKEAEKIRLKIYNPLNRALNELELLNPDESTRDDPNPDRAQLKSGLLKLAKRLLDLGYMPKDDHTYFSNEIKAKGADLIDSISTIREVVESSVGKSTTPKSRVAAKESRAPKKGKAAAAPAQAAAPRYKVNKQAQDLLAEIRAEKNKELYDKALPRIVKLVEERMNKLGLSKYITLNLHQKLKSRYSEKSVSGDETNGEYFDKIIQLAVGGKSDKQIMSTLDHESIHALRGLGMITPEEWNNLKKLVDNKNWLSLFNIEERYEPNKSAIDKDDKLTDSQKLDQWEDLKYEEAIADAFSTYSTGRSPVLSYGAANVPVYVYKKDLNLAGQPVGIINRILRILRLVKDVAGEDAVFKRLEKPIAPTQAETKQTEPKLSVAQRPARPDVEETEAPPKQAEKPKFSVAPTISKNIVRNDNGQWVYKGKLPETFYQWFGKSILKDKDGFPLILFHGTSRDIEKFKQKQANAIFVTQDATFAFDFAKMSQQWMFEHMDELISKERKEALTRQAEDIADRYIENKGLITSINGRSVIVDNSLIELMRRDLESGPSIMPLFVRGENLFDYRKPKHVAEVSKQLKINTGYSPATIKGYVRFIEVGDWSTIENEMSQKAIKDLGFDGFYARESERVNIAVYDPNQLKSVTGNSGEYSRESQDIRRSVAPRLEGNTGEQSTAKPSAKKQKLLEGEEILRDPIGQFLVITGSDIRAVPSHLQKVVDAISQYNAFPVSDDPDETLRNMHKTIVDNLVWLYDWIPANIRARAKLWYDGANLIANDMSNKYGYTTQQTAGVYAVLSPQKDWFMNVSLGERVIDIFKERQNESATLAMKAWVESYVKASKTKAERQKRIEFSQKFYRLRNNQLKNMSNKEAAVFVRVFDETYNPRQYRIITPEGGFLGFVENNETDESDTESDAVKDGHVAWGSLVTIEKAISVLRDGSKENISEQLGDMHKVRNFFNNILVPGSKAGHVTIDTHAVAAAFFKALSGASLEVSNNFGTAIPKSKRKKGEAGVSPGSSSFTGASGTYGFIADAYRDAAAQIAQRDGIELLPREVQSITWEAIRAIFPAAWKRENATKIESIYNRAKAGELTLKDARTEVKDLATTKAGGRFINEFAWEKATQGIKISDGGSSYERNIDPVIAKRKARVLDPEVIRDKLKINIAAATKSEQLPGISALYADAQAGSPAARQLLQEYAEDNLRHLLSGINGAKVVIKPAVGLYNKEIEPSVSMSVSFPEEQRAIVLSALNKFSDNFNQERFDVRELTNKKVGYVFDDGSYAAPAVYIKTKSALNDEQIQKVIDKTGLAGLTFGEDFIEAYYVPENSEDLKDSNGIDEFTKAIDRLTGALGQEMAGTLTEVQRIWGYGNVGTGYGVTVEKRNLGSYVPEGAEVSNKTVKRVANYLYNKNRIKLTEKQQKLLPEQLKVFAQPEELNPKQDALQSVIARFTDLLPNNDLKSKLTTKAYSNLADELVSQYKALPVKIEVLYERNKEGILQDPYGGVSSRMRKDIQDNNHLYIFATTKETFGPEGEDFSQHPLFKQSGLKDINGYPLRYNDLLRAVHDYFAHGIAGASFGPLGEESVWRNHMALTTDPLARWALTTETRSQNSWANYRENLDRSIPLKDRPFAPQKASLLPVEFALTGSPSVDKVMKAFIQDLAPAERLGSKVKDKAAFNRLLQEHRQKKTKGEYPKYSVAPMLSTPEFKRWFGDSKVVDAEGNPLVVYHGTNKDVTAFKRGVAGRPEVFFITSSRNLAGRFANMHGDGANVMPLYVRAENPYDLRSKNGMLALVKAAGVGYDKTTPADFYYNLMDNQKVVNYLKSAGYDGVLLREIDGEESIAVFDSEQIKSAIGNIGTYDPTDPDIRRSVAPKLTVSPYVGATGAFGGKPIPTAFTASDADPLTKHIYSWADRFIDLKDLQKDIEGTVGKLEEKYNAYLKEELYHYKAAYQTLQFMRTEVRPLFEAMKAEGITIDELNKYLHNRHAEERNDQIDKINQGVVQGLVGRGSGIQTDIARKYLKDLTPQARASLERVAVKVDAIMQGTRNLLVSSKLEEPGTVAVWEKTYPSYVPLERVMGDPDEDNLGFGTGQGYSIKKSVKRALGSTLDVEHIIANILAMRERTIVRAEKNEIGKAMFGMAVAHPNPDIYLAVDPDLPKNKGKNYASILATYGFSVAEAQNIAEFPETRSIDRQTGLVKKGRNPNLKNADNVLHLMIDGKEKLVFFNPRNARATRLVSTLKNLDVVSLSAGIQTVGGITRFLASVNTQYNPIFGIVNLIRDVQTGLINLESTPLAGSQKEVIRDFMPAIKGIWSQLRAEAKGGSGTGYWAAMFKRFELAGGPTGYRDIFANAGDRAKMIADEVKALKRGKVLKSLVGLKDMLSDYNTAFENGVRLAAFDAALRKGFSDAQAASIAKNLTVNFNRKGDNTLQTGALFAFFNASVQGTSRILQTMVKMENGKLVLTPAGKKVLYGGLLLGVMQAVALAAAGFDDDNPPQFVREKNLIIPLYGTEGKYITIPMPLGFNLLPNLSRSITEWAMSGFKNTPKRVGALAESIMSSLNPLGGGFGVQTFIPTVADPFVALAQNKDAFGRRIAKEDFSSLRETPGYLRTKETATFWSKGISEFLNYASGGNQFTKGAFSPTPDQIDYLIGQATGGVGRELGKIAQTGTSAFTGEELPSSKIPVLGRFYGDTEETASQNNKFYANMTRINVYAAEIKGRRTTPNTGTVSDYIKETPEARLVPLATSTYNAIKNLNEQKKQAIKLNRPKERIRQLEKLAQERMRQFNRRVEAFQP